MSCLKRKGTLVKDEEKVFKKGKRNLKVKNARKISKNKKQKTKAKNGKRKEDEIVPFFTSYRFHMCKVFQES